MDLRIEELGGSDKWEVLELFTKAFNNYPLFSAFSGKPGTIRAIMKAFLDLFGDAGKSYLYGIREDDRIVCASLSRDSTINPPPLALARFIFTLLRVLGWRSTKELASLYREKPKYRGRYLELIILGTLPAYQRRGYGRRMLRFLYNKAEREKYRGIILVADKGTYAFNLYLREGFTIDKEFTVYGRDFCWMRLEISHNCFV